MFEKMIEIFRTKRVFDESIRERLSLANEFGYKKIILSLTKPELFEEYDKKIEQLDGVDLIRSLEINPESVERMNNTVTRFRPKVNFIIINGGKENINRAAVEDKRIDLLYNHVKPNQRGINHVLAKKAKENSVAIGFNLKKILKRRGYIRSRLINHFIKNREITKKQGTPRVISLFSDNKYQVKGKRELNNLAKLIGFDENDLMHSNEYLEEQIGFNKKFDSDTFFEPGVEEFEESTSINEE